MNKDRFSDQSESTDLPETDGLARSLSPQALKMLSSKRYDEQVSYDQPFGKSFENESAIFTAEQMLEKVNEAGYKDLFDNPFADVGEFLYALECDLAGIYTGEETIVDLDDFIGNCTRCKLCENRKSIVNGEGSPNPGVMFVGAAPGPNEDEIGRPFVGPVGKLLDNIISAMGLEREDVFLSNVVRCRPPENRVPTLREIETCKNFLFHEIAILCPSVVVALGMTASRVLLGYATDFNEVRGRFSDFRGFPVMTTFHPAYLLRHPDRKREAWSDLKKVMEYLYEER